MRRHTFTTTKLLFSFQSESLCRSLLGRGASTTYNLLLAFVEVDGNVRVVDAETGL